MNIKIIKKELATKKNSILLLVTKLTDYPQLSCVVLKHISNELKLTGLCVTLNIPHDEYLSRLKRAGINYDGLFIDATGSSRKEMITKNCVYLTGIQSLTALSLAINAAVTTNRFSFVLLDSINSLLLYNDQKTVVRFIQYLFNKLRRLGINGIAFAVDETETNKLIPIISQYCDKCIVV